MASSLENEDLDNGPLVRMEDVQPSRDIYIVKDTRSNLDTFTVEDLPYDNECVVDDDDSNIGSMVSIHSEEVRDFVKSDDSNSSSEMIVPEVVGSHRLPKVVELQVEPTAKPQSESWPTLEILPGGVIKHSDKFEDNLSTDSDCENDAKDMIYACAKCSQSFKYLYCLVKHVKSHEKQTIKPKVSIPIKNTSSESRLLYIRKTRLLLEKNYKEQKVELMARIATALEKRNTFADVLVNK
ncbi:hypothetical protein ACJJTC_012935 [Scirpophaga incertulas]